jgi:hypothetical protein
MKKIKLLALFCLLLAPYLIHATGVPYSPLFFGEEAELIPGQPAQPGQPPQPIKRPQIYLPWLTGPQLAPSAHAVPIGHFNIEPYVFVTKNTGVYDKHWHSRKIPHFVNVNPQVPIQVGIGKKWTFIAVPQFSYNHVEKAHSWGFNDLPLALDYQVYLDDNAHWYPAVKFTFQETFPTGKYQKLDADKLGTDSFGQGSFQTSAGFVFSRLFHFYKHIFLAARLSAFYKVPAPVHVKGINAYGGAHDTHGKVYPGNNFTSIFGMELTLSQRWVLANDVMWVHNNKTRFSGHKGTTATGAKAVVGGPSNEQFVLAPALEYNWSSTIGLIAGPWFTVGGRNSANFIGGIIALNYYR